MNRVKVTRQSVS